MFESHFEKYVGNDCLTKIDGTNFRNQQKGGTKQGNLFGSRKYGGKSALRYELGVDILAGNLVWVGGPYPAGTWTDVKTFDDILSHLLDLGKHIEVDNGYISRADKVKCPNNYWNPTENLGMQSMARSHHETFNGRLKNWGVLSKIYHHDITVHGMVFYACVVVTQLSISNGEPMFEVKYAD